MTTAKRYTTATAAATEVDARARRHVDLHQGTSYKEAFASVLRADPELAQAYGQPARRARMATADKRSSPAVPVTADVRREIQDWLLRALEANMAGSLPGALGDLAVEADKFVKSGMSAEEAARRAVDSNPHLVTLAKLLLVDIRRNAPENKPSEDLAQDNAAGYIVHARAQALQANHPALDYREAVGAVLAEDAQLKVKYAGVK